MPSFTSLFFGEMKSVYSKSDTTSMLVHLKILRTTFHYNVYRYDMHIVRYGISINLTDISGFTNMVTMSLAFQFVLRRKLAQ